MSYSLPDLRYQKKAKDTTVMLTNLTKDFRIKTSIGIWCFFPSGGRFHERYVNNASLEEKLEIAAKLSKIGVDGIEAHYPDEINEDNIHLYKKMCRDTGMKIIGIPFSHFFDKLFEFGSLSNPDLKIRRRAVEIAVGGLNLVKEVGASCAVSWPGIDGYRYLHGKPFMKMWDLFESAMAEALDKVPGVMIAIEPKPYEPAANNIYRTTAEGILAAQRIEEKLKNPVNKKIIASGKVLIGLNPEIGHVKMGFEILPAAYSLTGMEGRLAHTHWNSQPDGNFDQDNNIGVVNPYESEALFYSLWAMGYTGFLGIDINPENMPIEKAVKINLNALNKMKERISRLPHKKIMECHMNPENNRGCLEEILIKHW
jgi:xylose isomerase